MDQSEVETEPERKIPTLVWIILAIILVVVFAGLVMLLFSPRDVVAPEAPSAGPTASEVVAPAPPGKSAD